MDTIERIKEATARFAPKAEVFLFGSQARGTAHAESDWDLLILLNQPSVSFEKEIELMNQFFKIELETGEVIVPLIYPKSEWYGKYKVTPLFENIQKEGIRLQ